jgi:AP2 domain
MLRKDARFCIARIDIPKTEGKGATHGWEVKIHRRGESVHKFFGDAKWGGKMKALHEAQGYRDTVLRKLKPLSRVEIAKTKTSRNKSGIVGVRRIDKARRKNENVYWSTFWEASWSPEPGVHKHKLFSVQKYGERQAKRLAVGAREKGLRLMARWHAQNPLQ